MDCLLRNRHARVKKTIFKAQIRFTVYPATVPDRALSAQNNCYHWYEHNLRQGIIDVRDFFKFFIMQILLDSVLSI